MKIRKRILGFLLALALALPSVAVTAVYARDVVYTAQEEAPYVFNPRVRLIANSATEVKVFE